AYENGQSPCTEVMNTPITFNDVYNSEGEQTPYTPKFSSTSFDGKLIPLRLGLAKSLNQTSARIMQEYNPSAVIEVARKMGVRSKLDNVYSLCLGVSDLKLSEITRAFSTFANKGFYIEPIYVTRIEDKNGNIIANFSSTKKEAISEITAYKMLKTMEGVTTVQNIKGNTASYGTGVWLRNRFNFEFPIAGKTGTTDNNSDGWFVGITPDLITGVWAGGEDKYIRFQNDDLGQGANMALPIYGFLMQRILADSTINISLEEFEAPEGYDYEAECNKIRNEEARKRRTTFEEEF
ncbi:penicillin-binding transpeptidase domain-containing protein, partial [Bacteroidota bacterium]